MINRVILVGRLTRDVEVRRTPSGKGVANFTLAVDKAFNKNADGDKSTANFISCVVWDKGADLLSKYCKKGSQIGIEGSLQSRTYDKKDGTKASILEVLVSNITLLGSKQSSSSTETSFDDQTISSNNDSLDLSTDDLIDDDLPF